MANSMRRSGREGFRNPLITSADLPDGGVTSAKLAVSLQSDNYVAGVSGWKIDRDTGDVEFGDGVFRGALSADDGVSRIVIDPNLFGGIPLIRIDADVSGTPTTRGSIYATSTVLTVEASAGANLNLDATGFPSGGDVVLRPGGVIALQATSAPQALVDVGSVGAPSLAFRGDTDTGIFRAAANVLGIASAGVSGLEVNGLGGWVKFPDGSVSNPGLMFLNDFDTGIHRSASDQLALVVGGAAAMTLRTSTPIFGIMMTTAAGATAHLSASNTLFRSTSSRRYKTALRRWDHRATVLDLDPTLFRSKLPGDDSRRVRLGLIAEDVAERFPLAAILDDEGRPESIDWNVISAGMLAELIRLSDRVRELESATLGPS